MKELRYWLAKVIFKVKKNDREVINTYFRKAGMEIGGVQHLLQYNDGRTISNINRKQCDDFWKCYVCYTR